MASFILGDVIEKCLHERKQKKAVITCLSLLEKVIQKICILEMY